jgi:hypothetical protein
MDRKDKDKLIEAVGHLKEGKEPSWSEDPINVIYWKRGYRKACDEIAGLIGRTISDGGDGTGFPKGKILKVIGLKVSETGGCEDSDVQEIMFVIKPSKDLPGNFKTGDRIKMVLMTDEQDDQA